MTTIYGGMIMKIPLIERVTGLRVACGLFIAVFILTGAGYGIAETPDTKKNDPLIDILIRKGILTEKEAAEITKEAQAQEKQKQQDMVQEIKEKELAVPEALKDLEVEALAYIDYSNGKTGGVANGSSSYNKFSVTRGYLTVKKGILPWLSTRVTLDTHQDAEGDWEMRLKYLYAQFAAPDMGPFTQMKSEVGLGHIPWLDFEEHINPYRCQGTMAIERAGVLNSADLGISLRGNFAGKLEDAKARTGNSHYDGRYGSWHIGVYNGSGYHTSEKNNNKALEGRVTARPLPDVVPGLQLSYFGIYGQGNSNSNAHGSWQDYEVNLGMLSYEHPWLTFTGQYFTTKGNAKGTWVDATGSALDTEGYSLFGKVKLPVLDEKLSVFGRWDYFNQDRDGDIGTHADYDMYIGGLAYEIFKGNLVLLTYETTDYHRDANTKGSTPVPTSFVPPFTNPNRLGEDHKVQVVYQIKY